MVEEEREREEGKDHTPSSDRGEHDRKYNNDTKKSVEGSDGKGKYLDDSERYSADEDESPTDVPGPPTISKSWTELTTHSPCYRGGNVIFPRAPLALSSVNSSPSKKSTGNFILTQYGGDVAIIEASTGILMRTIRRGAIFRSDIGKLGSPDEEDESDNKEDPDSVDAEAITAFDLSPNNFDLVAVTQSHLLRRYNLAKHIDRDIKSYYKNKEGTPTRNEINDDKKSILASETISSPDDEKISNQPVPIAFSYGKSGHSLPVTKISYHESGVFFATGSVDGLVKVWDARKGYATHALHPIASSSDTANYDKGRYTVTCLTWRPSAIHLILAVGREDGSVSIHDLLLNAADTEKASLPVAVLRDHISAVTCVAWHNVNSPRSARSASRQPCHGGGVFFTSGRDSILNTWLIQEEEHNYDGPKPKRKKSGGEGNIFSKKSNERPLSVKYQRIRALPLYEQIEGMLLMNYSFFSGAETTHHHQILDEKKIVLATCGTNGVVRLWEAICSGQQDDFAITDLSLLGSENKNDAPGEANGGYTSLHLAYLPTRGISPALVAVDAEHNMTFLRMTRDGVALELVEDKRIIGDIGEILDLSVIPYESSVERRPDTTVNANKENHHTVAVATNSSRISLFLLSKSLEDKAIEKSSKSHCQMTAKLSSQGKLDGHKAIVLAIDASPCGRYLASVSKDKNMRLWHIPSNKCVAIATGHTEAVGSVALSRKSASYDIGGKAADKGAGAFAVTASKDRTLKFWALPGSAALNKHATHVEESAAQELSLHARLSIRAHEKDINIVSVAPNDSLIATGSQDKSVKLWRVHDLALYGTLNGHKRGVWDCQFSPHDRVLATASGDRTIKLWSILDCACVRTFQGHMSGVLRVRFLATGLQMISSDSNGLLKLWSIRNNECETTIDGHDDKIWALDISPCGVTLVSGGADSKITVWRDNTADKENALREEEEKNIVMNQKLLNHLRHKQHDQALEIALELDKPHLVLKVLKEIVEKDDKKSSSAGDLEVLVKKWSLDRLSQVLKYCREWNTRACNSHIAMLLVKAVATTIPAAKLASYDGIPEILAGIAPYTERHFDRIDGIVGSSYLLSYTLSSMGRLYGDSDEDFAKWSQRTNYVSPQKFFDGKVQTGGLTVVGRNTNKKEDNSSSSEVLTLGESDSSEDYD